MAGVKGKSGGPRPNSGGKRPGAGRKPKAENSANAKTKQHDAAVRVELESQAHGGALKRSHAEPVPQHDDSDMLQFLQKVALGHTDATLIQVRAAIAAVQYTHTKRGDGGKKEEQAQAAKKAAGGKFGVRSGPPKLVVNN